MEISKQLSRLEILTTTDQLKAELDGFRPLSEAQEGRIFQKLRLDWNYHSNAIEGNSLTYGETRALLMYGLTAKGKPFKDHLDIRGHNEAIDFLLALVKDPRPLSEQDIRQMHKLVLQESYRTKAQTQDGKEMSKVITLGQYKTSTNHVKTATGEIHYYASPEETPAKMNDLMSWYAEASQSAEVHPLVMAALFHYRFVAIHPFDDGNGRIARLLMNLVLMRHNYPPVVIRQDSNSRNQYYNALAQADASDYTPFTTLIAEALIHSLEIYLKGAKGEDINEPDDLDKELALFRKELEGEQLKIELERSPKVASEVHKKYIHPLLNKIEAKLQKFTDLFLSQKYWLSRIEWLSDTDYEYRYNALLKYSDIFSFTLDKISSNKIHQPIITLLDFHSFKFGKNRFSIQLQLHINFTQHTYDIKFATQEINEETNQINDFKQSDVSISKFYHQPITELEAEHFAAQIGQDLLAHIKAKYKNGDNDSSLPL